ncbi:MAG TPA: OsmC family protein [Solirubrobacterales bacterium]|nr:OsmC family protein [Solirubrobacterales bacterium]
MPSAVARRRQGYEHEIEIREHRLISDEPPEKGGGDQGPKPTELLAAALASCTAITMEMYADRKEWGLGTVEVAADFTEATADDPPKFDLRITLGAALSEDNRDRLLTIAGRCPVHRALQAQDVVIHDSLAFAEDVEDED